MATKQSIFITLAAFLLLTSTVTGATFRRRLHHHPLFPGDSPAPAQSPKHTKPNATGHHSPPTPSAHPQSSTPAVAGEGETPAAPATGATTETPGSPFFPNYPSLSPPPPSPPAGDSSGSSIPTFPANISSLVVPHSRSSSSHRSATSPKLIAIAVVLSLIAVSLFAAFFLLRRHRRPDRSPLHHFFKQPPPPPEQTPTSDNAALYPPYSSTSDGRPPKLPLRSNNSSEFLYIGTLAASNSTELEPSHHESHYESPEIRPLPPLRPLHNHLRNSDSEATDVTDSEEFYSPANSSGRIEFFRSSSTKRASEEALARIEGLQHHSKTKLLQFSSYPDSNSSSPAHSARSGPSVLVNSASDSSNSCSPEYIMRPPPIIHRFPPPPPPPPPPAKGPPVLPQPLLRLNLSHIGN